jgi:hypothetical protein
MEMSVGSKWEFEGQITINGFNEMSRVSLYFPGQGQVLIRGIRASTPDLRDRKELTLYPFSPSMLCARVGRPAAGEFSFTVSGSEVGDYREVMNHPGDADIDVRAIDSFQVTNLPTPDSVLVRISGITSRPHKLMEGQSHDWEAPWNFVVALTIPRSTIKELLGD